MRNPSELLQQGDAFLVVDVQNDFCPGGALAVDEGDRVVPLINEWMAAARGRGVPIFASRDWHAKGHVSFADEGGPWPPHCIQDSPGAAFHPELELPEEAIKITKGVRFDQDQYSAFDQTGLADEMRRAGIRRLWIGGLARDVCVLASALDAAKAGLEVHVIQAATRPVTPDGGQKALEQMRAAGVVVENGDGR